jgi:hypothetical protein
MATAMTHASNTNGLLLFLINQRFMNKIQKSFVTQKFVLHLASFADMHQANFAQPNQGANYGSIALKPSLSISSRSRSRSGLGVVRSFGP